MNASIPRLPLRLAVPVIALAALVVAGEPIPAVDDAMLVAMPEHVPTCEDTVDYEADLVRASEHRSRTAMRLRWAVTLPDSTRPLSITLLP